MLGGLVAWGHMADRQAGGMSGVDLDLVATSYRTLSDPAAFEEMIDAWNRKLAMLQDEPDWSERGLSGDLFAHLTRLEQFARSADPPSDDPIRQVVEASEEAIMVQSPEGRIAAANDAGMRLFGASAGAFDRLAWLDPASRSELITIRRSAAENGNRQRAILRMVSLENGGRDEAHLVEARVLRVPTSDKGFVAIRALDLPWAAPVGEALAEAFALADAEVDVLRLFYASRDLSAVADTRGVSLKTVRTQFKAMGSEDKHLHPVETPRFADTMPQVVLRICAQAGERSLRHRLFRSLQLLGTDTFRRRIAGQLRPGACRCPGRPAHAAGVADGRGARDPAWRSARKAGAGMGSGTAVRAAMIAAADAPPRSAPLPCV